MENSFLQNLENAYCFCPYCGKFVKPSIENFGCKIQGSQTVCLGHQKCILAREDQQIKFQYSKSPYSLMKGYLNAGKVSSFLGGKQFILSSQITHPLSSYKYFKFGQKLIFDNGLISLNLEGQNLDNDFDPNVILVPLPQFNMELSLKELGIRNDEEIIKFGIDLSEIFSGLEITEKKSVWTVTASLPNQWIPKLQIELIFDNEEKKRLIDSMNFKYQHEISENIPLIKINKINLESKSYENKMEKSAIQNTKASSCFEDINEQSQEDEPIQIQNTFIPIRICEPKIQRDIFAFAKSQSGSKELQKKIKEMQSYELDELIEQIIPCAYQLLIDDYANYMIQTLVSVSNFLQRFRLFSALIDITPSIVNSKQGTFAFQQMIDHMQSHQEFTLISQKMAECFQQVATNANGNHFLRKLFTKMPFYYHEVIIRSVLSNFLVLVNNKNSVCVLKIILKQISYQPLTELIVEIKYHLFTILTLQSEMILTNEFGNYFIQQAYQIFGQSQLQGVSEFIYEKFNFLAKEKFSSSVICKCLNNYWVGTNYYDRLRKILGHNEILQLFRNREGNKVLLQLMASQADFSFKNKISSSISNDSPSKWNSSRWINTSGSRTGRAGQNYSNFSDAMHDYNKKNSPVHRKKNYNIQ